METRAMAIAFFFAIGTGIGGIVGPILFGQLMEQSIQAGAVGYLIGAGLMITAGTVQILFGVNTEGNSLEEITTPLSAQAESSGKADADLSRKESTQALATGNEQRATSNEQRLSLRSAEIPASKGTRLRSDPGCSAGAPPEAQSHQPLRAERQRR